jgi:homoserine kinase
MNHYARARVPATSANLGPGFDTLGLAFALYNEVIVRDFDSPAGPGLSQEHRRQAQAARDAGHRVAVLSDSARHDFGSVPPDESNIAWQAAQLLLRFIERDDAAFRMETINRIPLSRGLGSSSAARVGALVATNEWARRQGWNSASPAELLSLATELEGHPDNAAAALGGGLVASATLHAAPHEDAASHTSPGGDSFRGAVAVKLRMAGFPDFMVWIPDIELATKQARAALPDSVSRADAVFNVSRTALLLASLANGDMGVLRHALDDRLHQPYRAPLIASYDVMRREALGAGALGVTISGAGSSILIWLAPGDTSTHAVTRHAIETAAHAHRLDGELLSLAVDHEGCVILNSER